MTVCEAAEEDSPKWWAETVGGRGHGADPLVDGCAPELLTSLVDTNP